MPLPMGEVAERSEDGEGTHSQEKKVMYTKGSQALSVAFGDSSPGGRAKVADDCCHLHEGGKSIASLPCVLEAHTK